MAEMNAFVVHCTVGKQWFYWQCITLDRPQNLEAYALVAWKTSNFTHNKGRCWTNMVYSSL